MSALILSARLALVALRRNVVRGALTVVGIMIAVAALTVVTGIGVGAREEVAKQFKAMGLNAIYFTPDNTGLTTHSRLSESDAAAIARDVPGVTYVAPSIMTNLDVYSGEKTSQPTIIGTTRQYLSVKSTGVSSGELWTDADEINKSRVCVIGETLREKLFGDENPIGAMLRIGRHPFRIIGVQARIGLSPVGFDFDDTALVPLSTLRARIVHYEKGVVTNIGVSTTGPEGIPIIEQGVVALLRDRHRIGAGEPQDFRIINPQRLIKGGLQSYELLSTLLEAIAAISFLVGGVGVTNVMLVGIVERKREIGICLAIGAGPAQIALQFLVEAVVLSLFGGLAGVVLGIVSTYLVSSSFGWSVSLDVTTLTVGLGAAVMTGVAFGFVPALRAAQLDPIAAMRRD